MNMQTHFFPAGDRGKKNIGWLRSNFVFSFSDYYSPIKSAFGTLQAFNDDYIEPGQGFGIHPHINMEIISVLLQGKMNHKDSIGYTTVIEPGGVQIMSAGSGICHEEYNIGEDEVNFLQIWIQPKIQNITPRYQYRQFPKEGRVNNMITIVSGEEGPAHCWINQNTKLFMGYFQKGSEVPYIFNHENKCIFIFLIEGKLRVNDTPMQKRDALGVWETGHISLFCEETAEFLIIETPVNQK
jgi:quercetin 2,3-dioxygenase